MARIRVMATRERQATSSQPKLAYRAEAYVTEDRFEVPFWTCSHEHPSPQEAYECGREHLAEIGIPETAET